MKRPSLLVCSLALLTVTACSTKAKGVEVDALDLVPTGADFVAGFEVDSIRASPLGAPIWSAMATDPDFSSIAKGIGECDIEAKDLQGTIALDLATEDIVAVIEAPGIGSEKKMRCLENEIAKADGEFSGLMLFETHGSVRRVPQEGGGWLVILNKDAVGFVEGQFEDEFFERIEKPEARTKPPELAAAMERVDHTHDIWAAFVIDDAFRADLADFEGSEKASDIGFVLDFDDGLAMEVRIGFPADAQAEREAFEGAAKMVLEMSRGELGSLGLPEKTVKSFAIAHTDDAVSLTAKVPADELQAFGAMAIGAMAGL